MSKVNDSFHNLCIVHDVFCGRVNEKVFQYLIQKREDIFTVDDCGNITHIANHAIHPQTVNATEGGKVIATETFYDAVQLNLEDYLTIPSGWRPWRASIDSPKADRGRLNDTLCLNH